MWNPNEYSDEENARWCYIRALEWASWPIFISQPLAPIALLFLSWWSVVLGTVLVSIVWILFIRHAFVSPPLAYWGALAVRLKWVTCPLATGVLAYRGRMGQAALALLWPVLAPFLPVLLIPFGPARIGDIEKGFMRCLGYEPVVKD